MSILHSLASSQRSVPKGCAFPWADLTFSSTLKLWSLGSTSMMPMAPHLLCPQRLIFSLLRISSNRNQGLSFNPQRFWLVPGQATRSGFSGFICFDFSAPAPLVSPMPVNTSYSLFLPGLGSALSPLIPMQPFL